MMIAETSGRSLEWSAAAGQKHDRRARDLARRAYPEVEPFRMLTAMPERATLRSTHDTHESHDLPLFHETA